MELRSKVCNDINKVAGSELISSILLDAGIKGFIHKIPSEKNTMQIYGIYLSLEFVGFEGFSQLKRGSVLSDCLQG